MALAILACSPGAKMRDLAVQHIISFIPEGDGPFPALIAIPGCSGIAFSDSELETNHPDLTEDDRLFRRHYIEAAKRFSESGYIVLLIDVHAMEGVTTACAGEIPAERIADYIDLVAAWAPGLVQIKSNELHLIGWSMGGGGVLKWMSKRRANESAISAVITVYPDCRSTRVLKLRKPLLMLLGEADDIAPPEYCRDLAAASPGKNLIAIQSYEDARHGFDISGAPPVLDIGGMSVGANAKAADAAWHEILAFLEQ